MRFLHCESVVDDWFDFDYFLFYDEENCRYHFFSFYPLKYWIRKTHYRNIKGFKFLGFQYETYAGITVRNEE